MWETPSQSVNKRLEPGVVPQLCPATVPSEALMELAVPLLPQRLLLLLLGTATLATPDLQTGECLAPPLVTHRGWEPCAWSCSVPQVQDKP